MNRKFILHRSGDATRETVLRNAHAAIDAVDASKVWQVEITEHVSPRTSKQNKTLFGVVYPPIMESMGLSGQQAKEELHDVFCGLYWGVVEYEVLGQQKSRPVRTTTKNEHGKRDTLSKKDFGKFVDFVYLRAADYGIFVPDPVPHGMREI